MTFLLMIDAPCFQLGEKDDAGRGRLLKGSLSIGSVYMCHVPIVCLNQWAVPEMKQCTMHFARPMVQETYANEMLY